jgi:hypothetical protein
MRRTLLLSAGVSVVLMLLVGAALVGARMLRSSGQAPAAAGGGRVMEIMADDGSGPVPYRIRFAPAPELPDRPAEVGGIFLRRQDDSLFVGTGAIIADVEVNGDTGEEQFSLSHDGPEVEVVVTHDTAIFHDVTEFSPVDLPQDESGESVVQQRVKPVDSLEAVGANTELQVWGERRGDRVVAQVLVYRQAGGL